MKNKIIIGVVIFAAVLLLVYFISNNVNMQPKEASAKEVVCGIAVTNPYGFPVVKNGDLTISSVNCQWQLIRNCGGIFGVFSDRGGLRLSAEGGLGSATDINIPEGLTQSYSLRWCGSKSVFKFNIKILGEKNQEVQTKEVTV